MAHLIFMSIFFCVLGLIASTVAVASARGLRDVSSGNLEAIRWEEVFDDLPAGHRACRHALTGEIPGRVCTTNFDCRRCDTHAAWIAANPAPVGAQERMYHRGHAWVQPEADGSMTVGLDSLALDLIGTPEGIDLPAIGSRIEVNRPAWRMTSHGSSVRILSPIDGEVIETGGPDRGWYLKVKPVPGAMLTHLLHGAEVQPWERSELDRLQSLLAGEKETALAEIFLQ